MNRLGRSRASGSGQSPDSFEKFPAAPTGAAGDLDRTTTGTTTMRTYAEQRAMLAHMERAKADTERHLAIIERQIVIRAERATVNSRIKSRVFRRFSSNWSRADERDYQENVAILRLARRGEIDALARKLARQVGAIAAFHVRYRLDEQPEELAS